MDLKLIKKLDYFNMYANLGFQFDGIDKFEKYTIAYHNKIKDYWYNFITDIQADTKEEFDKIILEATPKMKAKNREVTIAVLPFMQEIYNNRDTYFDDDYELASNEVWQIYDDLDNINNINTNCLLNVKLEKTKNMKLYSEEMIKAYQTGDADDPYGDLDSIYKEVYENHKKIKNEYTEEFFFAKVNNESDIHYLDERPNKLDFNLSRKLTQYSLEIIEKLINIINKRKPDVSICLGDLIEDTFNHDKDIMNYTYIWNILKKINIPFYSVIGNHDLRTMNSRKEIEEIMEYKNATFSFDLNGYHFIILTTDIREDLGEDDGGIYKAQCISEKEIDWLKEDLVKNRLPCIIFTHFALAEDKQIGNYWFEKNPEDGLMNNRQDVKEIIKSDDNVIAVFSGHQHWTKQLKEDGKNYYVVGSLTDNIDMLGIPDGIYLEVELTDRNVKIIEKHIKVEDKNATRNNK